MATGEDPMRSLGTNSTVSRGAILLAAALLSPLISHAQAGPTSAPAPNALTQTDAGQVYQQYTDKYMQQNLGDPREDAAYRAFHKLPMQDADKKIKLGLAFINKYTKDIYTETVYVELIETYYAKQDFDNFYTYSDKALSLFPDDVPTLALTGWVIPRAYQPNQPGGDKKLDQAEADEKHALQALDGLAKPAGMNDQLFSQYKSGEAAVAHSALAMIYFRRERYEDSEKEMQLSMAAKADSDPTDFLVLGADYQNLGRFKEAADAFNRCAQVPGNYQATCKQQADSSLKMAADAK
jgi:tetratricopeptide (TPR) repeat protein